MSDVGYKIRVFRTTDMERVMNINTACLPENYSSYFYRDLYTKYPESFLVAEEDGEVQGYIMCRIERGWSKRGKLMPTRLTHIVSIAVMKDYRRKGIAENLIKKSMKKGREKYGASEVYLEVRVSNEPAVNLYLKLDFEKVKRNYGYYMNGEDAWVMASGLDKF